MNPQKTVIYISSCAVGLDGAPDVFMVQELPWLLSHFERVLLVSYHGVADLTDIEPEGLRNLSVLGSPWTKWRARLRAPFVRELWQELWRMLRLGSFSIRNGLKLLLFTARGLKMHFWLEELLRSCEPSHTTLYAYWMSFDAYGAALSKGKHEKLRLLVRGHAFDIDEQRNPANPYLMKGLIAKQADGVFLISQYAMGQYLRYMQGRVAPEKLHIVGVGSRGSVPGRIHPPPFFQEGELRIVSCAAIIEIKQVPVLVDALAQWKGPRVRWLHMGGGMEEAGLREYAGKKLGDRQEITYEITGRIDNEKVQEIYASQSFDVFVNTSRMEGIPVSIMEAMRHGIPVIAPRVGGIPELVDDAVGLLYDPQEGAAGVGKALQTFAGLSESKAMDMRAAAGKRWEARCRNEAILPLLFGGDASNEPIESGRYENQ